MHIDLPIDIFTFPACSPSRCLDSGAIVRYARAGNRSKSPFKRRKLCDALAGEQADWLPAQPSRWGWAVAAWTTW